MSDHSHDQESSKNQGSEFNQNLYEKSKEYYQRLFRRFVLLTLICSCMPLVLVGWGINYHYTHFTKDRVKQNFKNQIDSHRTMIELFLEDRKSTLQAITKTHTKEFMSQTSHLRRILGLLNMEYGQSFTDLGVIDHKGDHLAYIGPYDLIDKNYIKAHWFQEVMGKGVNISDIFMGYRKSPHFVIAVTNQEQGHRWILRATIDSESFRDFVAQIKIGQSGDVYLVNDKGQLQTKPRFRGHIMGKDPYKVMVLMWIFLGKYFDLGGPTLLAVLAMFICRILSWEDVQKDVAFDVVGLYAAACAMGAGLKFTGGALWLAQPFVHTLPDFLTQGSGLPLGVAALTGILTNLMSDGATVSALGPIVLPMAPLTDIHIWKVGLACAFSSSFAHCLVVGTPNNAIAFGMGKDPETGERLLDVMDFIKYGVPLWIICMIVLWLWTFVGYWTFLSWPVF